jgi:hypothetical protein
MKKNTIIRIVFLPVAILLFTTCGKTYMEKAQDKYSPASVVPKILSTSGPISVLRSFAFDYKVTYSRAGSKWSWTATDATVQSVSTDTKTATVLFSTLPASGKATISVTETTAGGVVSAPKVITVNVAQFCPLAISGFVGSWGGTDGFGTGTHLRASQVVVSTPTATGVSVTGLNFGWITVKWGETITAGGTVFMKINPNGTSEIADQYCFTTDYDGSPYEYWIKGTGTWANCGAKPTMVITYIIYYKSDGSILPADYYAGTPNFVATLTLN